MVGKTLAFLMLLTIVGWTRESFAMAKHVHFVDSDYEGKVIKGQPNGDKGTRRWYKTSDFIMFIDYPADHRTDWPLKQWVTVSIGPAQKERPRFKILKWRLIDEQNRDIPLQFGTKQGGPGVGNEFFEQEFIGRGNSLVFFCDIPDSVKEITLEFKIEIKMDSGKVHVVEESIPLKRAYYKTSLFEGLRY